MNSTAPSSAQTAGSTDESWNNPTFCLQGVILIHGARIGYFQGDIRLLMDDLKTLQPTVFPVVPRLLNRMFDKVRRRLVFLSSVCFLAGLNDVNSPPGFQSGQHTSEKMAAGLCLQEEGGGA